MSSSKNISPALKGEVVEIPRFEDFPFQRGRLNDQKAAELTWKYKKRVEIEELDPKDLKNLAAQFSLKVKKRGNNRLSKRLDFLIKKGNKAELINAVVDAGVYEKIVQTEEENRGKKNKKPVFKTEKLPYVEEADFEYKKMPVIDQDLAKKLGLPLQEERLMPVTKRQLVIPGREQREARDKIRVRKIFYDIDVEEAPGMEKREFDEEGKYIRTYVEPRLSKIGELILLGEPISSRLVKELSLMQEYKKSLQDADIEDLAELLLKEDIVVKNEAMAAYLEAILEYADIKKEDPDKMILNLEHEVAEAGGRKYVKKAPKAPVRDGEEEEISDEDREEVSEATEEDIIGDEDDDEDEDGGGAVRGVEGELEQRLEALKRDYAKNKEEYDQKVEEAKKNIKKLDKKLEKAGLTVEKVKKRIIGKLIKRKEEMEVEKHRLDVEYDEEAEKKEKRANPYNKKYPKFTRVKFTSKEGEKLQGVVMNFAEKGVDVSVVTGERKEPKIYKVAYTNPTLKRLKKIKAEEDTTQYMAFDDALTVEELYEEPVSKVLREMMVKFYTRAISKFKKEKKVIKKTEVKLQLPTMSWDEFWRSRYERWRFKIFKKHLEYDEDELEEEALDIYNEERDTEAIIEDIINLVDEFSDETTAYDFVNVLSEKRSLSAVEAYLYKNIERLGDKASETKGKDLALLIENSIQEYLENIPRNIETIKRDLKALKTRQQFLKHEAKKGGEKAEKKYLKKREEKLKKDYKAYKKEYGEETTEIEEVEIEVEDQKTVEEVKRFEEIVFKTSDGTVKGYLKYLLVPYLFIEGPLSQKADVFKAKLKNGSYKVEALASANLAHFLPEYVMRFLQNEQKMYDIGSVIQKLIEIEIDRILDLYLAVLNPTQRKSNKSTDEFAIAYPILQLAESVVKTCQEQSKTGKRPLVKDGKYVYRQGKMVMEDIPPGDIVMCYDSSDKKFLCFDSNEVLRDIKRTKKGKKVVNKDSGFVYPTEFLKKISERAEDIEIPGEMEEEAVEVKRFVPPRSEVRKVAARMQERKRKVPLYKPTKTREKKGFEDIGHVKQILLIGDVFDPYFDEINELFFEKPSITFFQGQPSKLAGPEVVRDIPLTNRLKSKSANLLVIGFDTAQDPEDIVAEVEKEYGKVKYKKDLYLLGVGPAPAKDRVAINSVIKESDALSDLKMIFYTHSYEEQDINDALVNIIIDVEGPDAVYQSKDYTDDDDVEKKGLLQPFHRKRWAYRAESPPKKKSEKTKKPKKVEKPKTEKPKKVEKKTEKPKLAPKPKLTKEERRKVRKFIKKRKEEATQRKARTMPKKKILKQIKEEREEAAQSDPLLRAAFMGDVQAVIELLPQTDDYDVVEVYKEVENVGGSKDVSKILRGDPRVLIAALDGDLDALKYLVERSDEVKFNPAILYEKARKLGSKEDVMAFLRKYDDVKIMLKEEFDRRMSKERQKKKR